MHAAVCRLGGGVYVGAYVAYLSMCVAAVVVNSEQKKEPTFPVKNQLEHFFKNRNPNLPGCHQSLGNERWEGRAGRMGTRGRTLLPSHCVTPPKQHFSWASASLSVIAGWRLGDL